MTTRAITDTIRHSDGTPWAAAVVSFRLIKGSYMAAAAYPKETVSVTTNGSGAYTATLWCDEEGAIATRYQVTYPDGESFRIDVPVGDGSTVAMSSLRTAVPYVAAANLQALLDVLDFTDLADAPDAYAGQGGKVVAVKSDVTGLEFITPASGGGAGGAVRSTNQAGGAAGTANNPGVAGRTSLSFPGTGGGGGGASVSAAGGAGGTGGAYGAGGGGGGASADGNNSGAGGASGAGMAFVVAW